MARMIGTQDLPPAPQPQDIEPLTGEQIDSVFKMASDWLEADKYLTRIGQPSVGDDGLDNMPARILRAIKAGVTGYEESDDG